MTKQYHHFGTERIIIHFSLFRLLKFKIFYCFRRENVIFGLKLLNFTRNFEAVVWHGISALLQYTTSSKPIFTLSLVKIKTANNPYNIQKILLTALIVFILTVTLILFLLICFFFLQMDFFSKSVKIQLSCVELGENGEK